METEILKWLLNQGGGYVLVAGLFYFYRRDIKHVVTGMKEQRDNTLKALISDTEVKVRLTSVVEGLAHIVEHCEIRRMNESITDDGERRRSER